MVSSTSNTPNLAGFGKVLNSIQGLQQRLDDFSVDDISEATEKARTLAVRLSELQRQLATLTEINESIATVRTAVDHAANETRELTKLEGLDRPLQLQAIAQASNLIRFPRVMKAAKDGPRVSSVNFIATDSRINTPSESLQTIQIETTSASPDETAVVGLDATASPTNTASAQVQETQPWQEEPPARSEQVSQSDTVKVHNPTLQTEAKATPVPQPVFESLETAIERQTEAPVSTSADFDQRLLDDLIKNYGEFAASPNLPASIKPAAKSAAKSKRETEHAESKARVGEFTKKNLPAVKKEGELDRQLKKLIKDYGEYDLYPQQSPVNLKNGVIAAVLLLALVFSGFYFFSAPTAPPRNAAANQSTSDSSNGTASPVKADGSGGKSLSNEDKRPGELRRAGEAGESRDVPDSSSVKRKK
ncbi:MAG: hypothetical protein E6J54_15790 [Deltaproteobacteria bacterium]|nr:MAG: hypothetical protein E6J54_15790 [Deltaproteobacteria bacterium]